MKDAYFHNITFYISHVQYTIFVATAVYHVIIYHRMAYFGGYKISKILWIYRTLKIFTLKIARLSSTTYYLATHPRKYIHEIFCFKVNFWQSSKIYVLENKSPSSMIIVTSLSILFKNVSCWLIKCDKLIAWNQNLWPNMRKESLYADKSSFVPKHSLFMKLLQLIQHKMRI